MSDLFKHHHYRSWFVFGKYPETGRVDVSDGERDVLTNVDEAKANWVIKERDEVLDRLDEVVQRNCPLCVSGVHVQQ